MADRIDVLVQFCGSCGYRNLFNQVQKHLQDNGADRIGTIEGMLYPAPILTAVTSQLLSYTFMLGIFLMLLGEWTFTTVVKSEPALKLVRMLKENQMITMIVLMAINMLANSLMNNGAFEVFFNGELVFSKLDTGLIPDQAYLMERFRNFKSASQLDADY